MINISFLVSFVFAPCMEPADVSAAATLPPWGSSFSYCGKSYDANRGNYLMFSIISFILWSEVCDPQFVLWNVFQHSYYVILYDYVIKNWLLVLVMPCVTLEEG